MDMPDTQAKVILTAVQLQDVPMEKLEAMKAYALKLRKKYPNWKPKRVQRKIVKEFHIKLI